jgi:hypothetical protein
MSRLVIKMGIQKIKNLSSKIGHNHNYINNSYYSIKLIRESKVNRKKTQTKIPSQSF